MIDSPEFARGRAGEKIVASILMRRGWFIVPSYDYSGKDDDQAPKMERGGERLIIPDLDICREGERRWAEVKTKGQPTLHRMSGVLEHGISIRHRDHYLRVQRESGCKVWLFIYEEQTGEVIYALLDELEPGREWRGNSRPGYRDMVFYPRSAFRRWAREDMAA